MNVLLDIFHLNGHTTGIHPQTQQLESIINSIINSTTGKYCSVAFIFNGNTLGFRQQTEKLEPPCKT